MPTNNGMPLEKGGRELIAEARNVDIDRATENGTSVVRADVAGRVGELVSFGSLGIVDGAGTMLASSRPLEADLLVAEVAVTPRRMILGNH